MSDVGLMIDAPPQPFASWRTPALPSPPETAPGFTGDVLSPAFQLHNSIGSILDAASRPGYPVDPTYDITKDAEVISPDSKYFPYLDSFVGVRSKQETQSVMSFIDRKQQAEDQLARSGWRGFVASALAGGLDPLTFVPAAGYIAKTAAAGRLVSSLISAGEGAAAVGGSTAVQQAVLQGVNPTQTFDESFWNTVTAAILGGVLGGGSSLFTRPELDALHADLIRSTVPEASAAGRVEAATVPNPFEAVGFNAKLAESGVAAADRPDFVAAYTRIANDYNGSIAELEAIRNEAGQPRTAPEYVAELARITQQREKDLAELDAVLRDYRTQVPAAHAAERSAPAPATEPPSVQGMVRLYHGGSEASQHGPGPRDFSTSRAYAEGYAAKSSDGSVTYIDLPKDHPLVAYDAAYGEAPPDIVKNVPEELARGRKPIRSAARASKIGQSIETKAVDARLTNGFEGTAGYDTITIKDQAERATNLVNKDVAHARAVVRGEEPLPSGLHGTALITAMEEHLKNNPSAEVAYELANSPLVSATSAAAQSLRLAAERAPDSIAAKFQQIKDARRAALEKRGGAKAAAKKVTDEIRGVIAAHASKRPTWESFIKSIEC